VLRDDGEYIGPVSVGEVFADGFETGDLSNWNVPGTNPAVNGSAAIHGNYGAEYTSGERFIWKAISDLGSVVGFRFYIDRNDWAISTGEESFICSFSSSYGNAPIKFYYQNDGGSHQFLLQHTDDEASFDFGTVQPFTGEHYVEILYKKETSDGAADGWMQWWVDGVFIEELSDLENYNQFAGLESLYFGTGSAWDGGATGSWYLDDVVVRDDDTYIGPAIGDITIDCNAAAT